MGLWIRAFMAGERSGSLLLRIRILHDDTEGRFSSFLRRTALRRQQAVLGPNVRQQAYALLETAKNQKLYRRRVLPSQPTRRFGDSTACCRRRPCGAKKLKRLGVIVKDAGSEKQ